MCGEFLVPYERATLVEHRKQLIDITNGSLLIFSLVNILWFIVEQGFLAICPLGFGAVVLFTIILIAQFVAMAYHRLMTTSYDLSQVDFHPKMMQDCQPRELSSVANIKLDRDQSINASA